MLNLRILGLGICTLALLADAQSTCSDLSFDISEPTSGTEDFEGTSYPRYSTGKVHYSPRISADCSDSNDVWISVVVESYDNSGNVYSFAQLPAKTAYTLGHQGDSELWAYPAGAQDFVWLHASLCSDQACSNTLIDYIGDTIFIGNTETAAPKGTGMVDGSASQRSITPPKPKKGSVSASLPNTNSTSSHSNSNPGGKSSTGSSKSNSALSHVTSSLNVLVVFAVAITLSSL